MPLMPLHFAERHNESLSHFVTTEAIVEIIFSMMSHLTTRMRHFDFIDISSSLMLISRWDDAITTPSSSIRYWYPSLFDTPAALAAKRALMCGHMPAIWCHFIVDAADYAIAFIDFSSRWFHRILICHFHYFGLPRLLLMPTSADWSLMRPISRYHADLAASFSRRCSHDAFAIARCVATIDEYRYLSLVRLRFDATLIVAWYFLWCRATTSRHFRLFLHHINITLSISYWLMVTLFVTFEYITAIVVYFFAWLITGHFIADTFIFCRHHCCWWGIWWFSFYISSSSSLFIISFILISFHCVKFHIFITLHMPLLIIEYFQYLHYCYSLALSLMRPQPLFSYH